MKKLIILLLVSLFLLPVTAQGRKYKKCMRKSIEMLSSASDPAVNLECADDFSMTAKKYEDQWLPYYYAAHALILISIQDQDTDRGDRQLDRADDYIKKAMERAPGESELYVMKAFSRVARITLDPESRGPLYFEDVLSSLNRAKQLNPGNPRAAYLDAMLVLNMPDFMGGGPDAAKPRFLDAQEKFESFRTDDPLWPAWGANLNQQALAGLE